MIYWLIAYLFVFILGFWLIYRSLKKKDSFQTLLYVIAIMLVSLFLFLGKEWLDNRFTSANGDKTSESPITEEENQDKDKENQRETEDREEVSDEDSRKEEQNESDEETLPEEEDNDEGNKEISRDKYYDPVNKTYLVQKGDTLWSISQYFGITVDELMAWNGLDSEKILVGSHIKVSGDPITEKPKSKTPVSKEPSILVYEGSPERKEIALTFDAGSGIEGIQILDVLKKHGVKSTFFLTGKWVEKFPDYTKRIYAEGHEIANHSYGHEDFTKISHEERINSIKKTDEAIQKVLGIKPAPLFRFPYGAYNQDALKSVGEAGYKYSIQWSSDTIDWQQPESSVIEERILSKAKNGGIVLMHIGGINTPKAVDQVIPKLKELGYEFVPVGKWFR